MLRIQHFFNKIEILKRINQSWIDPLEYRVKEIFDQSTFASVSFLLTISKPRKTRGSSYERWRRWWWWRRQELTLEHVALLLHPNIQVQFTSLLNKLLGFEELA